MPYTGCPLRKYNVTLDGTTAGSVVVRMSIRKAGSADFAVGADWTPSAGDVKVSKDGGSQANIGTLPSYSNGAWEFILTGTELSAKEIKVNIVDSATKAVDDDEFVLQTFGNASAMYPTVYSAGGAGNPLTSGSGTDQLTVSGGSVALTTGERDSVAAAILDLANGVVTGVTVRKALRGFGAALLGKVSGAGTTTVTFRSIGDAKDVIIATVDTAGNRTAITLDLT